MPRQFLDAKVAVNSLGGTAVTTTPAIFGTLGLNTSAAGPDLEIQFSATVTISVASSAPTNVTITINRISSLGTVPVYTVTEGFPTISGEGGRFAFTIAGADYHPPNPDGFLIYQAVVSVNSTTATPTRVGPESLIAAAYSEPAV
ncbi:hypothetical protein J25TS5_41500 [Paenibacillus faecis]|uniref:hypothetical protein n=1 Tax=Paenibacillus faecis TaxID=862114 RepID=UPI001B130F34|nr:hypothetical protein [Paenibacillus faecis]GIO87218.1 hypothetical protein J25TS5_41500 [Paenibacillus faecis]